MVQSSGRMRAIVRILGLQVIKYRETILVEQQSPFFFNFNHQLIVIFQEITQFPESIQKFFVCDNG